MPTLTRLLRVGLLAVLLAAVFVTTATGDAPACTHGASSVGPVTLAHGHLRGETAPRTEACLP